MSATLAMHDVCLLDSAAAARITYRYCAAVHQGDAEALPAADAVGDQLQKWYGGYRDALLALQRAVAQPAAVHTAAFAALMEVVRGERAGAFDDELFSKARNEKGLPVACAREVQQPPINTWRQPACGNGYK